jgi:prepilin peptidase CpaA
MYFIQQDFAHALLTISLLVVLALAVRQDLSEHRIANLLTLNGLVAALLLHSYSGGFSGFAGALAGAGVGLACFLPLYLCKGMGAGDVKLMAAAGAFLQPAGAFAAAMVSLASGAVLAVAFLIWRGRQMRTAATTGGVPAADGTFIPTSLSKERFPYAVAIAVGVLVTMWARGMLKALIP